MMTLNASQAVSPTVLHGLVGAWCPSLGPSGYTLLDRSGRGHHGTMTNMDAGSDWVGTPGGWALDFDGTNDYVELPSISIASELTIACWFYARSTAQAVIVNKQPTNTAFNLLMFSGSLLLRGGSLTAVSTAVSGSTLHHAVATIKATTGTIYLNGTQAATGTVNAIGNTTGVCELGRYGDFGGGYYFNGWLADVGLWNRALTAPEAAELYRRQQSGLGRLLTQRAQRRVFRTQAAAKAYLFLNRGQVIGGGML